MSTMNDGVIYWKWKAEQMGERVETAFLENEKLKSLLAEAESKASATQALLLECQAVLEFYGDADNFDFDADDYHSLGPAIWDSGTKAREMLEKLKG